MQPQAAIGEQLEALENVGPVIDVCLRPQFVLLSSGHCTGWTTEFLKFVQGWWALLFLECVVGYSYRDCLSEEIEILQLMLYREEFVQDPSSRKHCEPLLDKLELDIKEFSGLET